MPRSIKIPKWIQDDYNPTARQWLRWLRFKRHVKQVAAEGFDAMNDYFAACAKQRSCPRTGFTRASLHSGSSSTTLELFPWADFTRRNHEYLGTTISLDAETHDSDYRTLAEASYG